MTRSSMLALALALTLLPSLAFAAGAAPDPFLWLEDITGPRSMGWVAQQNKATTRELAESPAFQAMDARFLKILESNERIPFVTRHGRWYYNLWRDASHSRGLWRRTTLEEYRKSAPAWETVLDLDSLGKAENESWVWEGADVLPPANSRCLVRLSRGGADAVVVREFDLDTRSFVKDGFTLPESKSDLGWVDENHVFVGLAIDSSTMTTSGYPRVLKQWTRGTPLASAAAVYECAPSNVYAAAFHDHTPGFERDLVQRGMTTYTNELFLRRDGKLVRIDKPDDADANVWREWLLVQLRTDWTVGGRTYAAGSLVATKLEAFLAGKRDIGVVFQPTDRTSLAGYSSTRSALVLQVLDNVRSRIVVARPSAGAWTLTPESGLPENGAIEASAVDDLESDGFWLTVNDFLTPTTLLLDEKGDGAIERLKQSPSFFDGSRDAVSQHEAVSKDGTHVPYFEVAPKSAQLDGSNPTLLTGYGGFEIPITPHYLGVQGSGWVEPGGVLVVANIRGGGEFGPRWHQAAIRENRPRAYEDFIAVAEDVVRRGVALPRRLGCVGASNGGLLVGNMLTMRPDLFGAIVCESPLLDMRRYHKLLAGASWISEYGDPDNPKDWAYLHTYSPYANARKDAKYPRTLFTSSTRDDRVHPGHARKMVAKMEAQGHDVLYYENVEGGHAGAADNKQQAFMSALTYTFLWKQLGAPAHPAP